MMGKLAAALILLLLIFVAPLAVLAVGTVYTLILGRLEPLADYIFTYVLLLLVFGSGSIPILIHLLWKGEPANEIAEIVPFVVLGALGSAGFYAWFSADPMIGYSGVDFGAVVFGLVLGSLFGAAFAWLIRRRRTVWPVI